MRRYYLYYRDYPGAFGRYRNPNRSLWLVGAQTDEEAIEMANKEWIRNTKPRHKVKIVMKETRTIYEYDN